MPYADNLNIAGANARRVQEVKDKAVARLKEVGLVVHEELDACSTAQSLGFMVDGRVGEVVPVPDRLHMVQQAFLWMSRRPRVNGKAVQRLLGAAHFLMLKRDLLSIFRGLYDFVQLASDRKCRLWVSAARQARWIAHLLPLCRADLRKTFSDTLTASDASLSGIAVCTSQDKHNAVLSMGRVRESWRYKVRNSGSRPRRAALESMDTFEDPRTVKPIRFSFEDPFELNENFQEVPHDCLDPELWSLKFAQRMQFSKHITLLEGRGVVAALRHKFRAVQHFGKRHVHLCDNLGMVLALDKGRSSSMGLLRVCRRISCLLIATGSILNCRWIPSELNIADAGSRRWESIRSGKTVAKQSDQRSQKKKCLSSPVRMGPPGKTLQKLPSVQEHRKSFPLGKNPRHALRQKLQGQDKDKRAQKRSGFLKECGLSTFSGTILPGAERSVSGGGVRLPDSTQDIHEICLEEKAVSQTHSEIGRCLRDISQRSVRVRERL